MEQQAHASRGKNDYVPGWLTAIIILLCAAIGVLAVLFAMRILTIPLDINHLTEQQVQQASATEYSVSLDPPVISILKPGDRVQLTYTTQPTEFSLTAQWSSSDESILTVDQTGMVTALAPGTASVRVLFPDYSVSDGADFTVENA